MAADLAQSVKTALLRDLEQQRDGIRERSAELDEKAFWVRPLEPGNSVGHLLLHLTGNLNHFVGGPDRRHRLRAQSAARVHRNRVAGQECRPGSPG